MEDKSGLFYSPKHQIRSPSNGHNGILNGNSKPDPSSLTGDAIVCCGGYDGQYDLETVELLSLDTNSWLDLPSMPLASHSMAGGSYGKHIVVAGGINKTIPLKNTFLFDWQKQAWEEIGPLHSARAYCCGAVDCSRARLLVTGGLNGRELDSTESLDIKTGQWTKLPAMPTARTKSGSAIVGDYFAVVGGDVIGRPTDKVEMFNMKAEKWENFPAMTTKRRRCAVVAVGEKLVVAGGLTSGSYSLDTIEMFDLRNRKWLELPSMPSTRFGCGFCAIDTRLFLVGGNEKLKMKSYSNRLDSFDLQSHSWETLPAMFQRRNNPLAVPFTL